MNFFREKNWPGEQFASNANVRGPAGGGLRRFAVLAPAGGSEAMRAQIGTA